MSLQNYKCPSCGASLNYDPSSDTGKCDYCGSHFTLEEIEAFNKPGSDQETEVSEAKIEEIRGYSCDNCGAEVVSDATTSSTFCYYCHSPVILKPQVQGEFKPDYILPFAIDKKKAQDIFLNWAKSHTYVPRSFTDSSQLEKITGVYLPYWYADVETTVNVQGTGTKTHVYTRGETEYTEREVYEVNINGDFEIKHIPELAFTQIDRDLVKSIDNFSGDQLREFNMLYLSGFFSERYDIPKDEVKDRLMAQADNYVNDYIQSQLTAYDSVNKTEDQVDIDLKKISYVLLPTWILTYQYFGKNYVYMLNGQNGNAYGELPVDRVKLGIRSGIIFLIILAIALLGGRFIW